jgi:heme o synthase
MPAIESKLGLGPMPQPWKDYLELTKPRICLLALMMSTLGFILGSVGPVNPVRLFWSLLGIGLVGAASGILNQYIEREWDGQMWRTLNRPLPSGRVSPDHALHLGLLTGAIGETILLFAVNPVTAVLGATTLLFYLGIYTPSKRVSSLSTLIGAIPGAMPPLLGWTAAQGTLGAQGMLLFAILFVWQIPHFLAIAWIYREDYARGNFPVLPVIDEQGSDTAKQVIIYSLVLLPLTLVPAAWGVAGKIYFYGALVLGSLFLVQGIFLAVYRSKPYARRLFFASILYLPLLGFLMVWDRV